MPATSVLWFRRDLRLGDHPALLAASDGSRRVVPLFVLDPHLAVGGQPRTERLLASLRALSESLDGRLVVRTGAPAEVVPAFAREVGAQTVHVTRESTPYGRRRDEAVQRALAADGRQLVATGSPYAAGPGSVVTRAGGPYRVFTPFARAWRDRGWPAPAPRPGRVPWLADVPTEPLPKGDGPAAALGPAGEQAALHRWRTFLDEHLERYDAERDRPDLDTSSRMSVHLKYGEIHPRTMLADLAAHPAGRSDAAERYVTELAWREFYADVLWHEPASAWRDLRPDLCGLAYDAGPATEDLVEAWRTGRTGYPFVDAGMRQLLADGWMPNRLRMVTASFLTKDLHVWWPIGARHFLDHLVDGDLASNNHGWQWVAGTGTDAAPYFRVFNPVTQARRFDPDGAYVRRWVPELSHLDGAAVHEPWRDPDGGARGYPERVVDHDEERRVALARYELARHEHAGPEHARS